MDYCLICERDAPDIGAEVRELIGGVCVECWLNSVEDRIHEPDEIPAELQPLIGPRILAVVAANRAIEAAWLRGGGD